MLARHFTWWPRALAWLTLCVAPAHALEIRVVDAANRQPIEGATVQWRLGDADTHSERVNTAGVVKISIPATEARALRVTANHTGFAPMTMRWDAGGVPAQFEFPMPRAQIIGGRVLEAGKPVKDAAIALTVPQRLSGPYAAVDELKSDVDGRWSCEVPAEIAYVFVEIAHPDFESSGSEVTLEALRARSAEFNLYPVASLRGAVLDETGRAVANAELALGNEREIWPSSSTRESHTDAEGRFEFPRMQFGKRLLGVHAQGFAPTLLAVDIRRDATPLQIALNRGSMLRVRVVDSAGKPIPGASVKVDEWPSGLQNLDGKPPGRWSYPGWEWETDDDGRMVWSNAPPSTSLWTIAKGGFMSLGRHGLNPASEEQVVTLGPAFRASGTVTDAATGNRVTPFVFTPRFAQTHTVNTTLRTNFGRWNEYQRKQFSGGEFNFYRDSPLLYGSRTMHDWQFRVEAVGYEPSISRLVRDAERGLRLDFQLTPRRLPDIVVAPPSAGRRVTAGIAVQPRTPRPGDTLTLFVKTRIASGHHIYALEDSGCKNQPTAIEETVRGVLTPESPWRSPEPKIADDGSRILSGDVLFERLFRVEGRAGFKAHALPVTLRFQVCNDAVCWPVETISLEARFDTVNSPE